MMLSMAPRTSFLIPVRDGAETLGAALDSVLAQTVADFEVVVVDDGSTDGSAEVAEATGDPRVRVERIAATGLVGALNAGLAVCRGALVARMDADDWTHPERLERQLALLDADPTLAVVDGQVAFFRDHGEVPEGMRRYGAWVNGIVRPEDFERELSVESPIVHPAATIRRSALEAVGGYRDGPFPEDYDLWLRLHARGGRFRKVEEVLVRMRDRPQRLTRTDRRYSSAGFDRARRSWLEATHLARPRRVTLMGGGRLARSWTRWLRTRSHEVPAVFDAGPRAGTMMDGVRVLAPDRLPDVGPNLCLNLVAARGKREKIRALVARLRPEWVEGVDWLSLR